MKKFLLLSAALSSLIFAKTVSFDEALNSALKNNLELKAKKLNIDKAEADLKQAKGTELGKLTFSEEISKSNNALYVFGMKLESREASFKDFGFSDFLGVMPALMGGMVSGDQVLAIKPEDLNYPGSRSNFKTKFVYEVPLFTGFKLTYAKEMAKLQVKANKFKYAHDKNKLAIEVLKAYNGAVAAKSFIDALEIAKKTTTSFIKMINDFYKNGMATKVDLLEAKKRDNEVNAMLIEAKNKYALALAYLRFLTDDNEITDVGNFKIIIPPNKSISELQQIALNNRKDLKWMKSNLETMKKKVKFDKADEYPMIGAHVEYGFNDNQLINVHKDKDYYVLAAGLKWDIFNKATSSKVEKSKIEAAQVAKYYNYMKKGIKLDVEQKYLDYQAKKAVVGEKLTNKELAEEILKKYTYMYKQGMINITILLMKEAEARKARAELIKARYDEALAAAKLKEALGDLVKESK